MADDTRINPEQKEAICYGDGPMLIIAGAGTGKTTVVVERIKHLIIEEKVPASEILALTFTEKAAREMEERIDIALPYGYSQMWMLTFHAFCDRILKQDGIHIGLNPGFRLLTETESMLFIRRNLYKFHLEYFRPLGNPYKFLSGILQHFSRLKDDDISPEQYIEYANSIKDNDDIDDDEKKRIAELAQAFKIYEELKTKEGFMDFSDLIANVLKLFRNRKNILTYYQEKFKYILVDEFQDTNYAQNELAILLAGKRQNINVVGDDDQAIYRWRGAALANIVQFREHFPTSKIVTLNKNYRSTEEILTRSHQMIQFNNPDRLEVKEKINKQLLSMRGIKGEPVEFLFGPRVEHEAEAVIGKIIEQVKKHKREYKDIAILVRANDHAQPFVRAMERVGIPYQFLGPGHLFHQEEIKDLIAYLKVLVNFEDSAAMYRVLTMSVFEFSPRDIAAILNFAKKKNFSLFESLEQLDDTFLSDETKEKAKKLIDIIKSHLARVPRESAGQILYYFFENSGLLKKLLEPENEQEHTKVQNIAKFFEKIKGYEAAHEEASVFAIVDWIDLSMQLGESPLAADSDWSENNAVNILTIHSSKGLEFPVVFVVNLVTQRFPSRDRKDQIPIPTDLIREVLPDSDQNISEERRLFYVAMTRAKDKLYLTAANYYGEGKRERKLSPFIYEALGETYVNQIIQKKKVEASVKQLSLLDLMPIPVEQELSVEKPDIPFIPITYISYSQIQTYDMCPLHYKLRYILHIPPFPNSSLSYGTSVHGALRDYFQARIADPNIKISAKELISRVWIHEGYESKSHEEQALAQAEKTVDSYIMKYRQIAHPIAIEVPFSFTIDRMKVGGRIDRIDKLADGKIEIIDYKTGANIPDEKKLASDMQLTMYALAIREIEDPLLHKSPEEILLSLHYVEQDNILTTTRTSEQLDQAKDTIIKKADEIARSDYVCSITNCKNCEYKMICKTVSG